jgi:hypothetical protein
MVEKTLWQRRMETPCRYCGGIFRIVIVQVDHDGMVSVLRCDGCELQTREFDCGKHEDEQTRLILGERLEILPDLGGSGELKQLP